MTRSPYQAPYFELTLNLRNYSHSYEIIRLKHFEMSFTLGMSIIDDVIQNFQTSLVENGYVTVRLLLKYRARAAGCINIYYN